MSSHNVAKGGGIWASTIEYEQGFFKPRHITTSRPPKSRPALITYDTFGFSSETDRNILHAGVVMVFTTCQIANLKAAARKLPEGSRPVTPLSFLCGSPLTHAFSEIDQAPLSKGLLNTSPSVWPPIFSFFFRALLAGHMQACKRLRIVYSINFSGDAWDMGTAWAALCKRGRLSDLDSFNSSLDSEFLSE